MKMVTVKSDGSVLRPGATLIHPVSGGVCTYQAPVEYSSAVRPGRIRVATAWGGMHYPRASMFGLTVESVSGMEYAALVLSPYRTHD